MIRRLLFGPRRLEYSFAISTALLVIIVMGTTVGVVQQQVAKTLRNGLESRGMSIARSIAAVATPSLFAYNYAALQLAAERAAGDTDAAYVVIHDKEGVVAGTAGEAPAPTSGIAIPRVEPFTHDVRVVDSHGNPSLVLEVAVPVRVEGVKEPWGTVRVGMSYAPVVAELKRIRHNLATLGVALVLLAVVGGRVLARRITAPLRRLATGTEALSAGDMDHRIPVTGAKELADLAAAFNLMMERVREKAKESEEFQNALEELNATLEEQVEQRTRALQESEAQYKSLVVNSPDSIIIVQHGHVCFVNPAFRETFGISAQTALSPKFRFESLFESSAAAVARGRIEAWEKGEPAPPAEVLGKLASGRMLHLQLRGSQIEYRGAQAAECILVDMTEAKRLREHLAETEKLRALGELAGGVAHDFNNLLGAILGRAQLLRRRGVEPSIDLELSVIETAARDGRETVRRIQEFSRVRTRGRQETIDLAQVLRDAMEITATRWGADAQRRNVQINVTLEALEVPPILGNASELREVFTNLILNGVDAMPQGGRLTLSCRREGDHVVALVTDRGVGMTEEIRRQIFDPFFSTKGHGGMGLGMSVVYGIVTRHGGTIDVDTALGRGTTFRLRFPAAPHVRKEKGEEQADTQVLSETARILIIDDEPAVAEVLRDALAVEDHEVDMALSGSQGAKLACANTYDLVFSDLGMPDLTGWEVAERIRERKPDLPVVLVTGWGATLDEDEIRRCGISAVVHKPFEIDELLQTLHEVLRDAASRKPHATTP